jgi:hypothetical protein
MKAQSDNPLPHAVQLSSRSPRQPPVVAPHSPTSAALCARVHSLHARMHSLHARGDVQFPFVFGYTALPLASRSTPSFSWLFVVRLSLRSLRASSGAATQQIAPPTRAPAGRGPTDARHSRRARARSHHGHRAATVTLQSQRLMLTEMEDQPRAARRAEDEARVVFL